MYGRAGGSCDYRVYVCVCVCARESRACLRVCTCVRVLLACMCASRIVKTSTLSKIVYVEHIHLHIHIHIHIHVHVHVHSVKTSTLQTETKYVVDMHHITLKMRTWCTTRARHYPQMARLRR